MLAKSFSSMRFTPSSVRPFGANIYEKTFMASELTFKPRKTLKPKPASDHVYTFGGITTDYMLEIDFDRDNGGW
jgi:hypothetical protein